MNTEQQNSDDEQALLAAVIAAPDNDLPRLIYADWLEEHGQPERAEFIRVQVELAGIERGVKTRSGRLVTIAEDYDALRERERELLAWHEGDWLLALIESLDLLPVSLFRPPTASPAYRGGWLIGKGWFGWSRGFVESVNWPAAAWLEHGDAIRAAHPVTRVRLTTWPDRDSDKWRNGVCRGDNPDLVWYDNWPGVEFKLPPGLVPDNIVPPGTG